MVNESSNQAVGTVEGTEGSFRVIPGFELAVKSFNQVIRNDIVKVLNPNVFRIAKIELCRLSVSI